VEKDKVAKNNNNGTDGLPENMKFSGLQIKIWSYPKVLFASSKLSAHLALLFFVLKLRIKTLFNTGGCFFFSLRFDL